MRIIFTLLILLVSVSACKKVSLKYRILGNIEDPQNEIALAMVSIINRNLEDSLLIVPGIGSQANIDSLVSGKADLAIVDNYSSYHPAVSSIMPVYGQILHILHRKNYQPVNLTELFENKKIFAGTTGSGSWKFVHQLISDYSINKSKIQFVDVIDLFDADVIVAFTDLLSNNELTDLKEYTLFSLDNVNLLGRGSLVEGLCTRHPQFQPYIIPKDVYGDFTPTAILSVKVDAVLVCRSSLNEDFVFNIIEQLNAHKQEIATINPLLFRFSGDFNPKDLSFELHPGARKYLSRYEPGFFEKNADQFGVLLSIALAIASGAYSLSRWQRMKKKNKIDVYYAKLISLRNSVRSSSTKEEIERLEDELKQIQEETIMLVTTEKLLADESFSIFLNLSRFVLEEIHQKNVALRPKPNT